MVLCRDKIGCGEPELTAYVRFRSFFFLLFYKIYLYYYYVTYRVTAALGFSLTLPNCSADMGEGAVSAR